MLAAETEEHDYAELRSRITAAMRRVCPVWMNDQVDDLVQMSLMRIVRSYAGAQINTAFLHRVAHSVVIDEIRRRKRRNEVGITPSLPERVPSEIATPEVFVRGSELGVALLGAIGALLPDRRWAVTLHLQGHGIPEIAEMLELDRKQAENLVYRGMKDVRAALEDAGFAPG